MIFIRNAKELLAYTVIIFLFSHNILGKEKKDFKKSYFGSILAGQIANYRNETDIASEYFDYANKFNPKNKQIFNQSLMSLILSGKVDEAIKKIEKYKLLSQEETYKSQITDLLSFIKLVKESKNSEALSYLANNNKILITDKVKPILKAWLADNYEEAKIYLKETEYKGEGIALSNIYFHNLALLANFFDKKEEAFKAFNEGLKDLTLDKIRTLYFYSIFLNKNPQFKDEKKHLDKFYDKNPDHSFSKFIKKKYDETFIIKRSKNGVSELLYTLAETLYGQGMNDTSIAFAQISLYLNRDNSSSNYLLAENYQLIGKKTTAIDSLKKIKLESYLGWNAHLKISDLYADLKDFKKAKNYLLKLKSLESNSLDVYYKLGEQYHEQKEYKKAISSFSTGINLLENFNRSHWYIFYSRGMSYERSKMWKEAEKDFLFSLKLFPNQPLVLNYLGYSWIDFGTNLEKAERFIRRAIKLRPNDGYFIDSLGWAFYRMGDYKKAVYELEKAVEIVPNDPVINDHLGDALWRAGYKNEAVFQWKRSLLYKPEEDLKNNIKYKLKKGL